VFTVERRVLQWEFGSEGGRSTRGRGVMSQRLGTTKGRYKNLCICIHASKNLGKFFTKLKPRGIKVSFIWTLGFRCLNDCKRPWYDLWTFLKSVGIFDKL
jgi:hypothetical protein